MDYIDPSTAATRLRRDIQTRPRTVRFPMTPTEGAYPGGRRGGGRATGSVGGHKGLVDIGDRIGKLEARVRAALAGGKGGMALGLSRSSASFLATPNRITRRQAGHSLSWSSSGGGHSSSTGNLAYAVDSSQTGKLPRKGGSRSINPLPQAGEDSTPQGRQFADERLQEFADGYEREVNSFAAHVAHLVFSLVLVQLLNAKVVSHN